METALQPPAAAPVAHVPEPAKPSLVGLTRDELAAVVKDLGEPPFRVKQLWHWISPREALTMRLWCQGRV